MREIQPLPPRDRDRMPVPRPGDHRPHRVLRTAILAQRPRMIVQDGSTRDARLIVGDAPRLRWGLQRQTRVVAARRHPALHHPSGRRSPEPGRGSGDLRIDRSGVGDVPVAGSVIGHLHRRGGQRGDIRPRQAGRPRGIPIAVIDGVGVQRRGPRQAACGQQRDQDLQRRAGVVVDGEGDHCGRNRWFGCRESRRGCPRCCGPGRRWQRRWRGGRRLGRRSGAGAEHARGGHGEGLRRGIHRGSSLGHVVTNRKCSGVARVARIG